MKLSVSRIVVLGAALTLAAAGAFGAATEEGAAPAGPPTLRVATHTGWAATLAPASNDLPVYQEMERLSGVHVEWENIQVKNYAEVMKARLAAGVNLPDVINMSLLGDIGQHGRDGKNFAVSSFQSLVCILQAIRKRRQKRPENQPKQESLVNKIFC